MSKWHKGPPPSVGWWPASICENANMIRWWDGKNWSFPALECDPAERAAMYAKRVTGETLPIKWMDRPAHWPKRSRT